MLMEKSAVIIQTTVTGCKGPVLARHWPRFVSRQERQIGLTKATDNSD